MESNDNQGIRLNKYLSDAGFCSRREADKLIGAGQIFVDGVRAQVGMRILPGQKVTHGKKPVMPADEKIYLAVYKPVGIVCTEERKEPDNIIRFLNYPSRITYVGRLDKDSEGLLLMTNQGDIINRVMRAGNRHEKEYTVSIDKPVTDEFVRRMSEGVEILNTVTRPCQVRQTGKYQFTIVLTQGLNRQIRRMCEALGVKVRSLKRTRIMHIRLGDLKPGTYRNLREEEVRELYSLIEESSQTTVIDQAAKEEQDRIHRRLKERRRK